MQGKAKAYGLRGRELQTSTLTVLPVLERNAHWPWDADARLCRLEPCVQCAIRVERERLASCPRETHHKAHNRYTQARGVRGGDRMDEQEGVEEEEEESEEEGGKSYEIGASMHGRSCAPPAWSSAAVLRSRLAVAA